MLSQPFIFILTSDRLPSPFGNLIGVFYDLRRHLIIAFERLFGVGPERFHPLFVILFHRRSIDLKVDPPSVDDAEECISLVEPVSAEHPARLHAIETEELIENKVLERLVFLIHRSFAVDCRF